MKPVKQPPTGGLIISALIVFWLIVVSIVMAFNATTFGGWLWALLPFAVAGLIIWRVERTIRHYQDYCLWLEEDRIAVAQERQEMSERFYEIEREFDQHDWSWLDRYDDF